MNPIFDPGSYAFNPYSLPPLFLAGLIFSIGQLLILFESRNPINKSFSLLTVAIGLWFSPHAMVYFSTKASVAADWAKVATIGVALLPVAASNFALQFLNMKDHYRWSLRLCWLLSLGFILITLKTNLLVTGVHRFFWGYYPNYGRLGLPFTLFVFVVILLLLGMLLAEYKKSEQGIQKIRIKFVIIGFSIGALSTFDFLPKFDIPVYPIGYLPVTISLLVFYWLIRRYSLSDLSPEFAARDILKTMQGAVLVLDIQGNIKVINQTACDMLGYTFKEASALSIFSLVNMVDFGSRNTSLLSAKNLRMLWSRKNGQKVDVSVSTSPIRDRFGNNMGTVCVGMDITEFIQVQEALEMLAEVTSAGEEPGNIEQILLRSLSTICRLKQWDIGQAWLFDKAQNSLICSSGAFYTNKDVMAFRDASLSLRFGKGEGIPGKVWETGSATLFRDILEKESSIRGPHIEAFNLKRAFAFPVMSGKKFYGVLEFLSSNDLNPDAHFIEAVQKLSGNLGSIFERKEMVDELSQQAIMDSLTGLYNRRYFDIQIEQEITRAHRTGKPFTLLICDIDHFKKINDVRGHQFGDSLLKAVSSAFIETRRRSDLFFRWGGDEFAVILPETRRDEAAVLAKRLGKIIENINYGFQLQDHIDLSIGVALFPEHGNSSESLIKTADKALYIAKRGEDKFQVGEDRYSLDDDSVKTVFQRIVSIQTNKIIGYEALSRDPQNQISIYKLFKNYEAVGKLKELKKICFFKQLNEAIQLGLTRVFINIDFNLLEEVDPLPAPRDLEVILEISEREALLDIEKHLNIADKWRSRGFRFAIDDFGAGFISLPFMSKLLPDYIKMDRSTILQAVTDPVFRKFTINLVRTLESFVRAGIIAEGVETDEEMQIAKEMRTKFVQGFLTGRPEELAASMTQQTRVTGG